MTEIKIKPTDVPNSFICGKEMIEKAGIIEPEFGLIFYLFHEWEINKYGTDWIPNFPDSHRISAYCLPDDYTYWDYIENFIDGIEKSVSWKFMKLQSIKAE